MKIHQLPVEEALASLQSGLNGLSAAQAGQRLVEYGFNRIEKIRQESLALRFFKNFTHFFAVILWIAAAMAFFAESRDPGQGMATLGFAVIGVILINGLFSFLQEYRAQRALQALQKMLPRQVKVTRDGRTQIVSVEALVPGDLALLEEGDRIPADCRLIESFSVRVNNAAITGESLPHARDARPSEEANLTDSKNVLLAGTFLVSGEAKALVFATGLITSFGQIARLTQLAGERISPLQMEMVRLSRLVTFLALGLGVLFFWIGQTMGLTFWGNFIFAIGIIVANVPEGLLPTVTLSLAMGSLRMAKKNVLIRHLPAIETLGATTVICTDKTGTLTLNQMTVKKIFLAGRSWEYPTAGQLESLNAEYPSFFETARFCQTLKETEKEGKKQWLGDPMERVLVEFARQVIPENIQYPKIGEIPFDSLRRRISTVHQSPRGKILYCKGAPEAVFALCQQIQEGGRTLPLTAEKMEKFRAAQESMTEEGLRVLAFACRVFPDPCDVSAAEENLVLNGLIGLEDPPRPEVPAAIQKCKEAGIKVILVTGDHPQTATAVAREIGLVSSRTPAVITGDHLQRLSDVELQMALDAPEIIFARVTADQKMRIVGALKSKKEVVAATGDGVNDAPALKKADIGIAMGMSGTDVARESSDMILLDDNFAGIVAAIEEGRAVFVNIRKFLTYILTSNVPELVPYLAFVLLKIPLPLTIIQILAVDLGTDMFPALALGAEKPAPQIMKQPPRSSQERLLNAALVARAYLFLGLMQAIAAMSAYFFVLHQGGWHWGDPLARQDFLYRQATTACLSAIIVMQVVNVFICRSRRQSVFSFGFFSNPLIWLGICIEIVLILLIDYTPAGNLIFGTAPIPPVVWLFVIPFAVGILGIEEFRKWLMRLRMRFEN